MALHVASVFRRILEAIPQVRVHVYVENALYDRLGKSWLRPVSQEHKFDGVKLRVVFAQQMRVESAVVPHQHMLHTIVPLPGNNAFLNGTFLVRGRTEAVIADGQVATRKTAY
jgi:hypothetical protein